MWWFKKRKYLTFEEVAKRINQRGHLLWLQWVLLGNVKEDWKQKRDMFGMLKR